MYLSFSLSFILIIIEKKKKENVLVPVLKDVFTWTSLSTALGAILTSSVTGHLKALLMLRKSMEFQRSQVFSFCVLPCTS